MFAREWVPTAQLRWRVGVLQQAWTRQCSEWRAGGMRGMVHDFTETEWRDVRQATDEEIAAIRVSAQETGPIPFSGVVAGVNYEALAEATNPPEWPGPFGLCPDGQPHMPQAGSDPLMCCRCKNDLS